MTSHRAMKSLAEDTKAARALAAGLLKLGEADPQIVWTDWEVDFLESMAGRERDDALSTRQVEVLVELRNAAQRYTSFEGFSVVALIERCWQERLELSSDDDLDFIESLRDAGLTSLTRRQLGRLLHCCGELGLLEKHHLVMA